MEAHKTIEFRIVEIRKNIGKTIFVPEKRTSLGIMQPADLQPLWENLNLPNGIVSYEKYAQAVLAINDYIEANRPHQEIIHDLPDFTLKIPHTNE